jgi:hypothetical protein
MAEPCPTEYASSGRRARRFADLCGLMLLSARGRACSTGRFVQREYGTAAGREATDGVAQRNWWKRSKWKIRAGVAHEKITAMGYEIRARTGRVVARSRPRMPTAWRVFRRDLLGWACGRSTTSPTAGIDSGEQSILLWLAWSPFRVVLPLLDKSGCWPMWRCAGLGAMYLLTSTKNAEACLLDNSTHASGLESHLSQ